MKNAKQVKAKVGKILAKPKKKMKSMLSNKRKGYAKLAVHHDTTNTNCNYEDEELEMNIDVSYGMNESYNYADDVGDDGNREVTTTCSNATQTFIDDVLDQQVSQKTEYCVVPFYMLIGMISMMTSALLLIHEVSETLGMSILLLFGGLGSLIGMYGVYAWGIFDDMLRYLSQQNAQYHINIDRLNDVGEVLQNEVDDITASIEYLKRDAIALENASAAYDNLRQDLQQVCDTMDSSHSKHGHVMQLLDDCNDQCETMNTIVHDNEKAHLLSIFYTVKLYDFEDHSDGLDKTKYHRFLGYCNKQTRTLFEQQGGFDSMDEKKTGCIDEREFERMVKKVLTIREEKTGNKLNSAIKIQPML